MWQPGRGGAASGDASTLNTSESPSVGVASSLSDALEALVHPRFSLSAKACAGILKRAVRRGRDLPGPLRLALEGQAGPNWQEVDDLEAEMALEALTLDVDPPQPSERAPERTPTAPDTPEATRQCSPSPEPSTPATGEPTTTTPEPDESSQVAPSLTMRYGASGGNDLQQPNALVEDPTIGFHIHERMDVPRDDAQAPTLMKSASPGANAPGGLRKLTPTECERLMGWPDGWTVLLK